MVQESRSALMEDKHFVNIRNIGKHEVPNSLQWCFNDDYLSNELYGFSADEVACYKEISQEAFGIFQQATDKLIADNKLNYLGIPPSFHKAIERSWANQKSNPFLFGRFDLNGNFQDKNVKVIEFNADTCSTLPETIHWQALQQKELGQLQFNNLAQDMYTVLYELRNKIPDENAFFLASSFGYHEDVMNCDCVLEIAKKAGFDTQYVDIEEITFSEDEGIFYETDGTFRKAHVWYKLAPWDWMYNEEFELTQIIDDILRNELCVILNPPYTAIWQNKKFLAYITANFPNNCIAETYLDRPFAFDYVEKPIFGRLGENISIFTNSTLRTRGDFANQAKVFQKFYPLLKDSENYFYQVGMFYTTQPSALNLRTENKLIITDDCEFMSHFIL